MGAGHAHSLYVHGHTRVHHLAPQVKVAAAVAFVFAVAITPRSTLWPYLVDAAVLLAVIRAARLRPGFVASRAVVVLPFVVFAVLIPFVASGPRVDVLGIPVSEEGLRSAAHVLAKAILGVTTSVVLAGTTELPRILAGLDRLRVPSVLTQIAGFMLRYLEVVTGELRRMRTSMTARGYDPRWISQVVRSPPPAAPCSCAATSAANGCTAPCWPAATPARCPPCTTTRPRPGTGRWACCRPPSPSLPR